MRSKKGLACLVGGCGVGVRANGAIGGRGTRKRGLGRGRVYGWLGWEDFLHMVILTKCVCVGGGVKIKEGIILSKVDFRRIPGTI